MDIYDSNLEKDKNLSSNNFNIPKRCFINILSKVKNNIKITNSPTNFMHENIKKQLFEDIFLLFTLRSTKTAY